MAKLNKNGDFNSINKDTMPLDTRVKHEYDKADTVRLDSRRGYEYDNLASSCHSRAIDSSTLSPLGPIRGSRNKDIMPLDTRVRHEYDKADTMPLDTRIESEYDNLESFSCHSGLRAGIQRGDNLMPKAFRFDQSGRSMVEMLGVLAVVGVLSIGGIMGYSYAVDKYHANQVMNDVNLRGIDLIAQASRGGDLSLAEWPTKTSGDLDIGLEVDETTNTTEGGIYVKDVEKRICEIIADDLLPEEVELVIDGEAYTSGNCGETNKMVFYYDAVGEALGGGNQNCVETENGCVSCPAGATISADKTACECLNGQTWDATTNECTGNTCEMAMNESGMNAENFSVDGNTITITANGDIELPALSVENCNLVFDVPEGLIELSGDIKAKSLTSDNIVGIQGMDHVLSVKQMSIPNGTTFIRVELSGVNINSNGTITMVANTLKDSTVDTKEMIGMSGFAIINSTINADNVSLDGVISNSTITADDIALNSSIMGNILTFTARNAITLDDAQIVESDNMNVTFTADKFNMTSVTAPMNTGKIKVVVPSDDPCNIIVDGACVGPNNPFNS